MVFEMLIYMYNMKGRYYTNIDCSWGRWLKLFPRGALETATIFPRAEDLRENSSGLQSTKGQ